MTEKFSFNVPFRAVEYVDNTRQVKEFSIQGVAINATTTRNGVTYLADELEKSAATLKGKVLLKDHKNEVDSIVGKVKDAKYNRNTRQIEFEAKVIDPAIEKKIRMGLLSSVSIGAAVKDLEKTRDEQGNPMQIARGIDFLELSLVAVPSDPNATFTYMGFENLVLEKFNKSNEKEAEKKVLELIRQEAENAKR